MQYDDDYEVVTCNPSLRKGTLVLTSDGVVPIETLQDKEFYTYNIDGKLSKAKCFLSGHNKQLYKITLDNNKEYYCTPEHKWAVLNQQNNTYEKKLTTDIVAGDYFPLNVNIDKLSDGKLGDYNDGLFCGLWYGDGHLTIRKDDGRYQYGYTCGKYDAENGILDFVVDKMSEITEKDIHYSIRQREHQEWYEICCGDKKLRQYFEQFGIENKNKFPSKLYSECSEDFRRGFVSGLFSSDGSVSTYSPRITLSSSKEIIINEMSDLLWWYGIRNRIDTSSRVMELVKDKPKTYTRYDLTIGKGAIHRFNEIFKLYHADKDRKVQINLSKPIEHNLKIYTNMQVKNIELVDIYEDVWDIHVYDDSHTFPLNYCITGNCGEQPLKAGSSCNLGSINLSEFVKYPYTEDAMFDWDSFKEAVRIGITALDGIIDENLSRHALKEQAENSQNYRNVGLGCMGYANMLFKLGIEYGSDKCIAFTKGLFSSMLCEALKTSALLAKELGAFPKCKKDKILESDIIEHLVLNNPSAYEVTKLIEKYGLRNCSLLSIAPTGSTK